MSKNWKKHMESLYDKKVINFTKNQWDKWVKDCYDILHEEDKKGEREASNTCGAAKNLAKLYHLPEIKDRQQKAASLLNALKGFGFGGGSKKSRKSRKSKQSRKSQKVKSRASKSRRKTKSRQSRKQSKKLKQEIELSKEMSKRVSRKTPMIASSHGISLLKRSKRNMSKGRPLASARDFLLATSILTAALSPYDPHPLAQKSKIAPDTQVHLDWHKGQFPDKELSSSQYKTLIKRSKKGKRLATIQEQEGGGEIIYINWPIINDNGDKIPFFWKAEVIGEKGNNIKVRWVDLKEGKSNPQWIKKNTPRATPQEIEIATTMIEGFKLYESNINQQEGGKWSLKYKRKINCKRPKGFSQKQYCKRILKKKRKSSTKKNRKKRTKKSRKMRGGKRVLNWIPVPYGLNDSIRQDEDRLYFLIKKKKDSDNFGEDTNPNVERNRIIKNVLIKNKSNTFDFTAHWGTGNFKNLNVQKNFMPAYLEDANSGDVYLVVPAKKTSEEYDNTRQSKKVKYENFR